MTLRKTRNFQNILEYFVISKYNIVKIKCFGGDNMEYLTVKEAGEKWGLTARMVNYYCSAGRIDRAVKKGNLWLVPRDACKPPDMRRQPVQRSEDA